MPQPNKPADSEDELTFVSALKRLLSKHKDVKTGSEDGDAQEHALGGLTRKRAIDRVVDEAVEGAKGANPDY